jgi:hypothetical protein
VVSFCPGIPVSSTNKTDRQDITELLLKLALNTINLKLFLLAIVLPILRLTASDYTFGIFKLFMDMLQLSKYF